MNKTKIFVGPDTTNTHQITVYSNIVNNKTFGNTMILPVPYPETVKFHSLADYKLFFVNIKEDFENMVPKIRIGTHAGGEKQYIKSGTSYLSKFNVGSYEVSLATTLQEIKNADPSVFTISPGCYKMLEETYMESYWGFILCKLSVNNEKYHPMAYSHKILNNSFFIPTRHYHEEAPEFDTMLGNRYTIPLGNKFPFDPYNENSYEHQNPQSVVSTNKHIAHDWNHAIYIYNCDLTKLPTKSIYRWKNTCHIFREYLDFPLAPVNVFSKIKIQGVYENKDLVSPILPLAA